MLKKILSVLSAVVLVFLLTTNLNSVHAESSDSNQKDVSTEILNDNDLVDAFRKIITYSDNVVDSEYYQLDESDFSSDIKLSDNLKKVLIYKQKISDIFSEKVTSDKKVNYTLKLKDFKRKDIDDLSFYEGNAEIRFNYFDLPDTYSGQGKPVQFVTRTNPLDGSVEIIDFFDPEDYRLREIDEYDSLYDLYSKSKNSNISNRSTLDNKEEYPLLNLSDLEDNFLEIYNEIEEDSNNETEENNYKIQSFNDLSSVIEENNFSNVYSSSVPLSKYQIKMYARRNCSKDNPSPGWSNVPYYDFSDISGNYDCTNFVSHALLAGGANVYNTGNPSTGWYFSSLNNRSYSWSGVQPLRNFLVANNNGGPFGHELPYKTYSSKSSIPYEEGDIIQFYQYGYGNWRHSGIITKFYEIEPNKYGVVYCARIAKGNGYEYDMKAEKKYGSAPKRVISLDGTK